jgi:hypothetical protein
MRESSQVPAISLGRLRRPAPDHDAWPDPEQALAVLRRRATIALVVHVVLALCLFAVPSIAGAVTAGLARRAAVTDLARGDRLLRWSWAFLAVDLLFYVLLAVVGAILAAYLFLIVKAGT